MLGEEYPSYSYSTEIAKEKGKFGVVANHGGYLFLHIWKSMVQPPSFSAASNSNSKLHLFKNTAAENICLRLL